MKEWRWFVMGICKDCGSGLEVLAHANNGSIREGDKVRCNNYCGATGKVETGQGWVKWDEKE